MRNWMRGAAIVVVTILAIVVVAALLWYSGKQRQAALADFKADVIASGFTLLPGDNPSIEDETSGTGKKAKTKTTLEALVVVNGCTVELERAYDESRNAGKRGGRTIELYELDEALQGHDEVEIDGAPTSPTPEQVTEFLKQDGRFDYCLTA